MISACWSTTAVNSRIGAKAKKSLSGLSGSATRAWRIFSKTSARNSESPFVPSGAGTFEVPLIPLTLNGRPACHSNSTSRSGSLTGKVLSSTASTTLKMAVFAPMPNASESTATVVKPLCLSSIRQP